MIRLQRLNATGTECPKCKHESVFKRKVYYLYFFYLYTTYECHMDNCNYELIEI